MAAAEVPTAMAHVCETAEQAEAALDAFGPPYVVKDDALAAGKGVVVTDDRQAALDHAAACDRVVIEEFLDGPEVSLFAITDGETVLPLQPAQDFKRAHDGDEGPNTGGMGAYTPLDWAPDDLVAEVSRRVLVPTVQEMARRGTPFQGLLYAGLALTSRGVARDRVQRPLRRSGDAGPAGRCCETPLSALLNGAATGTLGEVGMPQWRTESAVTVVMAADGYPESPRKGDAITGIDRGRRARGRRRHPRRHRARRRRARDRGRPCPVGHGDRRDPRRGARRAYAGVGRDQLRRRPRPYGYRPRCGRWDNGGVTTPNVLASRYASPELARIWSPEHKIVLERRLWIAVLTAQKDLGVETPDGVIESYESVIDQVDLASIAEREKVTRHDVKARIEEFAALAGTEHIHKGMTSRDLTENVEQLQIKASLELIRDRGVATLGPARTARRASTPSS